MKAWIAHGDLGCPVMMWAHEFRAAFYTPWRYDVAISGGTLVEKCCHHFDLFHWMLGSPVNRLVGFGGQAAIRAGTDVETIVGTVLRVPDTRLLDHAWVLTDHANGTRASLGLSLFSPHGPYGKTDADLEGLEVGVIGDARKLIAHVRRNEVRYWPRGRGADRAPGCHSGGLAGMARRRPRAVGGIHHLRPDRYHSCVRRHPGRPGSAAGLRRRAKDRRRPDGAPGRDRTRGRGPLVRDRVIGHPVGG